MRAIFTALVLSLVVVDGRDWVYDEGFCEYLNEFAACNAIDLPAAREQLASSMRDVQDVTLDDAMPEELLKNIVFTINNEPCSLNVSATCPFRPWTACTEGPIQAPSSHTLINQTDSVQILTVQISPNHREPFHTHEPFSIMITNVGGDSGCGQNYYDELNEILFSTPPHTPDPYMPLHIQWMLPEWFHAIENTGGCEYDAGNSFFSYRFLFR